MKNSALQLTRAYIYDNDQYIDGNVADHLLLNAQNAERGYFDYLSDEEIYEYENDSKRRKELENEVESFINENFDFDISEY